MSIFSSFRLNEILFNNKNDNELKEFDNLQSNNDLNIRRYPSNLGSSSVNHYIQFEIFVRENSNPDFYSSSNAISNGDPISYQITELMSRTRGGGGGNLSQQASVATSAQIGNNQWERPGNQVGGNPAYQARNKAAFNDVNISLPKLKKTKEIIALYMPDAGLQFNYGHRYETPSATNVLGGGLLAAQAAASSIPNIKNFMQGGGFKSFKQMSPFAVEVISQKILGPEATNILYGNIGMAINPSFEVIYSSTDLRNFSFEFMFYPRDEKEAETVYRIIQAFKFHAAPEITKGTAGRYLLAPSAFDIKFMYNGLENPNIPKISTCFCNGVNVDYAPNGFSAYEVQGDNTPQRGKTGTPVATRLTLSFTETTMITKELIRGTVLNDSPFNGAF